jgi:hypothetical protein
MAAALPTSTRSAAHGSGRSLATLAEKPAVDPVTAEAFRMLVVTGEFENASGVPLLASGASAYGLSAQ